MAPDRQPDLDEIEARLSAVVEGRMTRADADRWAARWMLDDSPLPDPECPRRKRLDQTGSGRACRVGTVLPRDDGDRETGEDVNTTQAGTTVLWRPTGPEELELVRQSGWRAWPRRLPDQPIFYPVLNEDYAIRIARDWNVPSSGVGYVTRFRVETEFLSRYPVRQVGGETILELWVPAEELDEFNAHIVGLIEVVHEFR